MPIAPGETVAVLLTGQLCFYHCCGTGGPATNCRQACGHWLPSSYAVIPEGSKGIDNVTQTWYDSYVRQNKALHNDSTLTSSRTLPSAPANASVRAVHEGGQPVKQEAIKCLA